MSYVRVNKDPLEEVVNESLTKYQNDVFDCGAGYAIIRYAEKGLLNLKEDVSAKEFLDWHPGNPAYVILRLANQGKLSYKKQ